MSTLANFKELTYVGGYGGYVVYRNQSGKFVLTDHWYGTILSEHDSWEEASAAALAALHRSRGIE